MSTEFREFLDGLPERDTTPPGVKAVEDYTFDELITHLHDYHGYTAESQADDELSNDTDQAIVDAVAAMTRDEAIKRLPGHYFQLWDSPDSLASAIEHHRQDHGDYFGGGATGKRHFHPGQDRTKA